MKHMLAAVLLISALTACGQEQPALGDLMQRAEQGDADAQYNLGLMYNNGLGVPQNLVQAHKWLSLAVSSKDSADANRNVELREAIVADMTPEQLAEAERLASEWTPKTWEELQ